MLAASKEDTVANKNDWEEKRETAAKKDTVSTTYMPDTTHANAETEAGNRQVDNTTATSTKQLGEYGTGTTEI